MPQDLQAPRANFTRTRIETAGGAAVSASGASSDPPGPTSPEQELRPPCRRTGSRTAPRSPRANFTRTRIETMMASAYPRTRRAPPGPTSPEQELRPADLAAPVAPVPTFPPGPTSPEQELRPHDLLAS